MRLFAVSSTTGSGQSAAYDGGAPRAAPSDDRRAPSGASQCGFPRLSSQFIIGRRADSLDRQKPPPVGERLLFRPPSGIWCDLNID